MRSIIASSAISEKEKKSKVEELQRILAKVRKDLNRFEGKKEDDAKDDKKSDQEENGDKNSETSSDSKSLLDSKKIIKSAEKKPQESAKVQGVRETLKNLTVKLKEIEQKRKKSVGNESENVKGFTVGGASKEVDGVDKEIEMLQSLIAESQAKLLAFQILAQQKQLTVDDVKAVQGAVRDYIEDAKNKGMIIGEKDENRQNDKSLILSFSSSEAAMQVARNIAAQYESFGIPTSISSVQVGQKNLITVTVEIPNQLAGKDPLSLDPKEILEALQGEKSIDGQQQENKNQQQKIGSWVERVGGNKVVEAGLGVQTGWANDGWVSRVQNQGANAISKDGNTRS